MDNELNDTKWNKKRAVALLFAVFCGPFTWLYTFRKDAWKASLGLSVTVNWLIFVAMIFFIPVHTEGYERIGAAILSLFILPVMWLWAVIDTGIKSGGWFKSGYTKRNKWAAILLAVFLGPWTWLYTYSYDAWKFWLGIVVGYGFLALNNIPLFEGLLGYAWMVGCLTIWIGSIVNSSVRGRDFYGRVGKEYSGQTTRIKDRRINLAVVLSWSFVIAAIVGCIIGGYIHHNPPKGSAAWYWLRAEEALSAGGADIEMRGGAIPQETAAWYWGRAAVALSAGRDAYKEGQSNESRQYLVEAIKYLDAGIKLEPNNSKFIESRGYAHAELGEYELAIKDYSQAIILNPESIYLYLDRSLAYISLGMDELAIADLTKCTNLTKDRSLIFLCDGVLERLRARAK